MANAGLWTSPSVIGKRNRVRVIRFVDRVFLFCCENFFLFENGICVVDLFMGVANLKKFRRERFFIWVVLPSRCLARSVFCDLRESTVFALQK